MRHNRPPSPRTKLARARAALTAILNPTRSMTYKQRVTFMRAMAKCGLELSK